MNVIISHSSSEKSILHLIKHQLTFIYYIFTLNKISIIDYQINTLAHPQKLSRKRRFDCNGTIILYESHVGPWNIKEQTKERKRSVRSNQNIKVACQGVNDGVDIRLVRGYFAIPCRDHQVTLFPSRRKDDQIKVRQVERGSDVN